MTVLVAMTYFGVPELVERAVRSVLDSRHRDLHLLVIGDGQGPPLAGIRDDRLDVYTLPENRGTFFGHQLALRANPHRWHALVDADDWIDEDHLSRLMAIAKTGATAISAPAVRWHHGDDPEGTVHVGSYIVGMFRRWRLTEIGGFNPAERMGQDTLTLRLLRLVGRVAEGSVDEPTYHRLRRPDSLTTAPETRIGSVERNAMRVRNRAVFTTCQRLRSAAAIAAYRTSIVPPRTADELAEHVERLRAAIA